MSEDRRDLLQVLRYELSFLEQGGYRAAHNPRDLRPFQDTLSCLNFGEPMRPHACHECCLYELVPPESRTEDVPCHFIPLDDQGNTLTKLMNSGDSERMKTSLRGWLQRTITELEGKILTPIADLDTRL